jgi:hypothetical protein
MLRPRTVESYATMPVSEMEREHQCDLDDVAGGSQDRRKRNCRAPVKSIRHPTAWVTAVVETSRRDSLGKCDVTRWLR